MKIAVYHDLPFGGAHIAMEEILKRLSQKHEIRVFNNQSHSPLNFPPRRLWTDLDSLLLQPFKQRRLATAIDRGHFDLVLVSHDRHFQAPWILRFLKTPTLFLCQEPTRALFEQFLAVDPKLPTLNYYYEIINRFFRKNIEIKNAGFATKIIANSVYSTEAIFRAYGLSATPILLGYNPQNFFPESNRKKNQVIIVGNHEPQKALIFGLECLSQIPLRDRPHLIIVSPRHRQNKELIKLAKKSAISLKIYEKISVPTLRRLYNQSQISLALAHLEPFGLSVVESLACGTPVVAVREGGFREIIVHGRTGLLIERNAAQIALAIQTLSGDPQKLLAMSKAGIIDVKKRFTWTRTVDQLEKALHETIHH